MPTTITGNSGVSQVQAGATSDGLPLFQCRAWVNFDGTRDSTGAASTANTARFIRASGNVSSVVRNGTGNYTVNFTAPLPDANYAVFVSNRGIGRNPHPLTLTAGSVQVENVDDNAVYPGSRFDSDTMSVAIFR